MRPLATTVAIALLGIVGLGALGMAGLMAALTASTFAHPVMWLVAGASLVYAIVAGLAAVGLWRRAAWGWMSGFAVGAVGVLGVGVAAMTGGFQAPLAIAIVLCGAIVALLLAPETRRDAGVA